MNTTTEKFKTRRTARRAGKSGNAVYFYFDKNKAAKGHSAWDVKLKIQNAITGIGTYSCEEAAKTVVDFAGNYLAENSENIDLSSAKIAISQWAFESGIKRQQSRSQGQGLFRISETERINRAGYLEIYTGKGWVNKHYSVWEAEFGEIPKGYYPVFKDGDKSNFSIENLLLVSRSEIRRRNVGNPTPLHLMPLVDALCEVKRAIVNHPDYQTTPPVNFWTDEEIDFLRINSETLSVNAIAEKLNRSIRSVKSKADKLNIVLAEDRRKDSKGSGNGTPKIWTEDKLRFLKENLFSMPLSALAEKLGVNPRSIKRQIRLNYLPRPDAFHNKRYWSDNDDSFLKNNFEQLSFAEIAFQLKRTKAAVKLRCRHLGLCKKFNKIKTPDEIAKFKELYPVTRNDEVAEFFNCHKRTVEATAKKLGIEKSTRRAMIAPNFEEVYLTHTNQETADYFNCSVRYVQEIAKKLNISKVKSTSPGKLGIDFWTPENIERFKLFYSTHTNKETAIEFGICVDTVQVRARRYGVPKKGFGRK